MLSAKLLKTRITLLTLGVVLLGFWALALHTTVFLRGHGASDRRAAGHGDGTDCLPH